MSTFEPDFEYPVRSARMRDADGAEYAVLGELRDRFLEDYINDMSVRIDTQTGRGIDGGRPASTFDGAGSIDGGTP